MIRLPCEAVNVSFHNGTVAGIQVCIILKPVHCSFGVDVGVGPAWCSSPGSGSRCRLRQSLHTAAEIVEASPTAGELLMGREWADLILPWPVEVERSYLPRHLILDGTRDNIRVLFQARPADSLAERRHAGIRTGWLRPEEEPH